MRQATKFRRSSLSPILQKSVLGGNRPGAFSGFLSRISDDDTASLLDDEFLVRRLRPQFLDLPARPTNDNRLDLSRRTQAEMDARVARTLKAASRAHFCIAG